MRFEAASVKPASPDNPPGQGLSRAPEDDSPPSTCRCAFLILYAYQLQGHQLIGAPDWTANERFDIVAKMEGDPPSIVTAGPDPMRLATQTLLAIASVCGLIVRRASSISMHSRWRGPADNPAARSKPSPEDCAVMAARDASRRAGEVPGPDGTHRPSFAGSSLEGDASVSVDIPLSAPRQWIVTDRRSRGGRSQPASPVTGLRAPYAAEPSPISDAADACSRAIQDTSDSGSSRSTGPVEVLVVESVQRPASH
jgi:hypothetical protein